MIAAHYQLLATVIAQLKIVFILYTVKNVTCSMSEEHMTYKREWKVILNFKPFLSKFECVPFHFSLKGHIVNRDFSFFILESNIDDVNLIKTKEAFYINCVYKIDKKIIINDFIPAIFFRKWSKS